MATIVPLPAFDPEETATILNDALKSSDSYKSEVVSEIFTTRTNEQLGRVVDGFRRLYGKDLKTELQSTFKSDFLHVLEGLVTPRLAYFVEQLDKALNKMVADEDLMIELLCSYGVEDIEDMRNGYDQLHPDMPLEKRLRKEYNGHLQQLFVALIAVGRDRTKEMDVEEARNIALFLANDCQKGKNLNLDEFTRIFTNKNSVQLKEIEFQYMKWKGVSLKHTVSTYCKGSLKVAYITILDHIDDTPLYFAKRLLATMKGLGTDEYNLTRLMISRSEIDLRKIEESFATICERSLKTYIISDTSKDYQKILLKILKSEN
ncbi:hypothetical protein SNEBB_008926 [Seison nebaliae]|nr:hypothetical protein SNEBB_008926 [Seison nebaliae]